MSNKLHFKFNDSLNKKDSEEKTYGCRQNNPEICKNNGVEEICAFCREDKMCQKPSRAWKKQYLILRKLEGDKNE